MLGRARSHIGHSRIGELEQCVLERLWASGSSNPKAMHRAVGITRGISHNTIQTTLERLFRKKLLERVKVSHAYVYFPLITRDGLISRMISDVFEALSSDKDDLVSAFVDLASRADEKTLNKLKRLIARYRADIEEK